MNSLRFVLLLFFVSISVYTVVVIANYGPDLIDPFFGEIGRGTWSGQFNFDFWCYLFLSALWILWRHQFSAISFLLALIAMIFGIMFFAPYLIYLSFKEQGSLKGILLGLHND